MILINMLAMKQFTYLSKMKHGMYVKCIFISRGPCLIEPITYVLPIHHNLWTQDICCHKHSFHCGSICIYQSMKTVSFSVSIVMPLSCISKLWIHVSYVWIYLLSFCFISWFVFKKMKALICELFLFICLYFGTCLVT